MNLLCDAFVLFCVRVFCLGGCVLYCCLCCCFWGSCVESMLCVFLFVVNCFICDYTRFFLNCLFNQYY